MARYVASTRTAAGSTTLPIFSLYSIAAVRPKIKEVGVFNSAAVAVAIGLQRLTSAGTPGAAVTKAKQDPDAVAGSCTPFTTHTVGPTLGDLLHRFTTAAAIGSGVVWTFGPDGLLVPVGTANGIGIVITTGTGQICDVYVVWDE